MKQVTAILLGAGQRGVDAYASYALNFPTELKMVGVAEPRTDRRAAFCAAHDIPEEKSFDSWEKILALPKFADCVFVCTQDRMHYQPVMQALAKGYHVLCEKPMSPERSELIAMGQQAKTSGKILSICHVLRYSPFFTKIKELIDSGALGQLVSIQHIESVGYWHMAHSFVRGNWRSSEETSPMILAKCCHDMDILLWLTGGHCESLSSFGSLAHFKAENAPAGAPAYCMDGCPHRDGCPYYAPRFYLEHPKSFTDGFAKTVCLDRSREGILNALKTGPYGRCVYHCDNDVVDNQVVNMTFDNHVTVSMEMCAFTEKCERVINVMGSKGQLRGNMEENKLELLDFVSGNKTEILLHTPAGGHSGSDVSMMKEFVALVAADGKIASKSSADLSVESHLIALAAEESRLQGGKPVQIENRRSTVLQNAVTPEKIPTYDGSNQSTHPSVLFFENGWQGYRYWMAMTPYPFNMDDREDPSILASQDGRNWEVPHGVTNPLTPKPEPGHNCDVELIYVPEEDALRMYYVEADDVAQSWVKMMRSTDGVHWSAPEVVIHDAQWMYGILSPTIQRMEDGSWQMLYVDTGNTGYQNQSNAVRLRTSPDGLVWSDPTTVPDLTQPGYQIWHMEVRRDPKTDTLHAVYPAYPNGTNCDYCELFYAVKRPGEGWTTFATPLLTAGAGDAWDNFCIYRSSLLLNSDTGAMQLWYGAKKKEDASWNMGYLEARYPEMMAALTENGQP